jgi:hypothetical protein
MYRKHFAPLSLVQSNIQVTGMLLLPFEQAYKANHLLSRNKVQLHRAFAVIPLFYHFPPPNNIQQNELRVIGVWGRAKQ